MTTENGSSRSQAEVHERTQDEITNADLRNVVNWLNDNLVPLLRNCGYDIGPDEWIGVEQVTDPEQKIKIDAELMRNGYKLKKEYLEKTYGVELEDAPEPVVPPANDPTKKPDPEKKK
jgi:hypothetical protein